MVVLVGILVDCKVVEFVLIVVVAVCAVVVWSVVVAFVVVVFPVVFHLAVVFGVGFVGCDHICVV